jgi:hypothetical protein
MDTPISQDQMPLWDLIPYYGVPQEQDFILTNSPQLVARADPQRRVLVLGALNTGGAVTGGILAVCGNTGSLTGVTGFPIQQTNPTVYLTWDSHKVLVQQPWFAMLPTGSAATINMAVMAVTYLSWPEQGQKPSLIEQVDNGNSNPGAGRANRYRQQYNEYTNRWSQPAACEASDIGALIESCASGAEWGRDSNGRLALDRWGISSGPW